MQYKKIVSWLEHESGLAEEDEKKAKALRLAAHLNLAMCFLKVKELTQALENCDKVPLLGRTRASVEECMKSTSSLRLGFSYYQSLNVDQCRCFCLVFIGR